MAGQGPPPKDPALRRNTTSPKRGEWVDLEPLAEPVLAELPPDETWPPLTRAAWDAWRRDPVSGQWSEADVAYALDTIRLHGQMTANPTRAAEVRLRMDSLGLTPKGKRDLRWRIKAEKADEAQSETPRRASRSSRRRSHLTAVA